MCPWKFFGASSAARWDAIRRWLKAVVDGRLFQRVRLPPEDLSRLALIDRAWFGQGDRDFGHVEVENFEPDEIEPFAHVEIDELVRPR
jgi:hypothetical protein